MKIWVLVLCFSSSKFLLSQSVEDWVRRGLEFDSTENYSQAINCYNKAIELAPAYSIIWYNRGISYMGLKKYSLAAVDFNKSLYLDSTFTDAYYNRSWAYRYTGNYQFALADLSEFIQRNPEDYDAVLDRIDLAFEMKELQVAVKDLTTLLAVFPDRADLKNLLFQAYYQSADYGRALQIIDELIEAQPGDHLLKLNKAYALFYNNEYEASLNALNLYLINQPASKEVLKLKADNHFFLKHFGDASLLYESLILQDSTNANLLADYGHCLLQLGQFKTADSILTRSIRARNESPAYAYLGRGIARYNLNLGDLACEDWWKSSKLGETRAQEYLKQNCQKENTTENR